MSFEVESFFMVSSVVAFDLQVSSPNAIGSNPVKIGSESKTGG